MTRTQRNRLAKQSNNDRIKNIGKISDKKARQILKTQKPLSLGNLKKDGWTDIAPNFKPVMKNLTEDVYMNQQFQQFKQFSNFRNMGNLVFYKSANGKVLEVMVENGQVIWVESGHGGVEENDKGFGGSDTVKPEERKDDNNFKDDESIPVNQQESSDVGGIVPKQKPIIPKTKQGAKTSQQRLEETYKNPTRFQKRIDKIKKGWNVKDKALETYTQITRKVKNVKHPTNLLNKITDVYSKFKQSKNKFNFFQTYKKQWERVKKAYNIKVTLEELIEDLI